MSKAARGKPHAVVGGKCPGFQTQETEGSLGETVGCSKTSTSSADTSPVCPMASCEEEIKNAVVFKSVVLSFFKRKIIYETLSENADKS